MPAFVFCVHSPAFLSGTFIFLLPSDNISFSMSARALLLKSFNSLTGTNGAPSISTVISASSHIKAVPPSFFNCFMTSALVAGCFSDFSSMSP